jgi:RNA polymerase sigma-70 factor, ECF subfamily
VAETTIGLHLEAGASPGDVVVSTVEPVADALLSGLQAGAEEAFEALVLRYQQPVYNLVYRLLSDPSEASDVVQEVFLKVFRAVGGFRQQSSLKTWIYRIAVNEANNHRRWFGRHRKREVGLETEEEGVRDYRESLADPGRSPYDSALSSEQRHLVEESLARLKPVFQLAVTLRDVDDLSYEEIAEITQVSLGTVKSRILRGREALRRELAGKLEPGAALTWTPQPAE